MQEKIIVRSQEASVVKYNVFMNYKPEVNTNKNTSNYSSIFDFRKYESDDFLSYFPNVYFDEHSNQIIFLNSEEKIVGKIDEENMNEFINSTSCLLRLTLHDGFPATIAEWAACLRPSICNIKDMPKCNVVDVDPENMNYVRDKEKIVYKLRELKDSINSDDSMQKMREAREYFRVLLDPEKFKKRIYEVCL